MTMSKALAPGYYVLIATQTGADGTAKAGTPARYAFRVAGAPVAGGAAASPWSGAPGGPSGFGTVGGVTGQTLLIGGIGTLTLIAAGSVLVGRRNQRTTLSV